MLSLQDFTDQVRQALVETNDELSRHELYSRFVNECAQLQLSEDDFYKTVLKPAHKSIDWEAVEAAKKQQQETHKKMEAELAEKKETIQNAPIYIERLVKTAFEDGIVEGEELGKIFDKAASLGQNTTQLALDINLRLDEGHFKSYPRANFDAGSLKGTLISTNWYNPQLYASITAPPPPEPEPTNWKKIITATVLLLAVAGTVLYFAWYKGYIKDKNATRMYSYANDLFLRSSPEAGVDYNKIKPINYGGEVLVYKNTGEWSSVKVNGKKGYAASAFMLPKKEFQELNAIFADDNTREAIASTKYRKALLGYFQQKNIIGKMDPSIQRELYGSETSKEIWQVKSRGKKVTPDNILYQRVLSTNPKNPDFGCIIEQYPAGGRKFLLFTFSDNGTPSLVYEENAPSLGYISSMSRNYNGTINVTYTNPH